MNYPIERCKYITHYVDSKGITPHTHSTTSEIIFTFDNQGDFLINNTLIQFPENGLFFVHGPSTHFVAPYNMDRYPHIILVLNTAELQKMCRNLHLTDIYNMLFIEKGGTVCTLSPETALTVQRYLLEASLTIKKDDSLKYAEQAAILTKLFTIGINNSTSSPEKSDIIKAILSYINENISHKITLNDISAATNTSVYYLCKVFKKNLGISIGAYITIQRLSMAKQMLIETNMTVTKIAAACYFADSSIFAKTFSREFGITPSDYRKKYR